jgi:hypothetical protein
LQLQMPVNGTVFEMGLVRVNFVPDAFQPHCTLKWELVRVNIVPGAC